MLINDADSLEVMQTQFPRSRQLKWGEKNAIAVEYPFSVKIIRCEMQ